MRTTQINSEVLVVLEGKAQKGKIVEVITPGAARIQLGDTKGTVQASYSLSGEEGTFHYPEEAKSVKAADTFGEPPQTEPAPAAEPGPKKKNAANRN